MSKFSDNKCERIDYKDVLSERDFALYAQLRNLRKFLSEQEGVPTYALFTNDVSTLTIFHLNSRVTL